MSALPGLLLIGFAFAFAVTPVSATDTNLVDFSKPNFPWTFKYTAQPDHDGIVLRDIAYNGWYAIYRASLPEILVEYIEDVNQDCADPHDVSSPYTHFHDDLDSVHFVPPVEVIQITKGWRLKAHFEWPGSYHYHQIWDFTTESGGIMKALLEIAGNGHPTCQNSAGKVVPYYNLRWRIDFEMSFSRRDGIGNYFEYRYASRGWSVIEYEDARIAGNWAGVLAWRVWSDRYLERLVQIKPYRFADEAYFLYWHNQYTACTQSPNTDHDLADECEGPSNRDWITPAECIYWAICQPVNVVFWYNAPDVLKSGKATTTGFDIINV